METKKKIVSVVIAASLGVPGTIKFVNQDFSSEDAIEGAMGVAPLHVNLEEAFFGKNGCYEGQKPTDPIIINSISFITKADTTKLPDYKDYLVQGILYYDREGERATRTFRDSVGIESKEYQLVTGKENVAAKFNLGKDDYLCMDLTDMDIEFTWVTPSAISICDLRATDTEGNVYDVALGEIYTAYVSEKTFTSTSSSGMPFGCDFYMSSVYGDDNGRWHEGVDLCAQGDYTIYATHGGEVVYSDWENSYDYSQGYGQYIVIKGHDDNYYVYGHLAERYVAKGERVEPGQPIGFEGTTGYSTGDHLHYGVYDSNMEAINAAEVLGIPNDYGMVHLEDYVESAESAEASNDDKELAIQCLSFNKHFEAGNLKANAINPDDCGGCSIGIVQMHDVNAKKLLTAIRNKNTKEFDRIAKKYDSNIIGYLSDNNWGSRTAYPGTPFFNFLTEVMMEDWAVEAQWDYVIEYELDIIEDARSNGITDPKSILLYTRAYNYGPYTDSAIALRNLGNKNECSFENAASTVGFLKAAEAVRIIDEMSFKILTIDDIK